MAETVARAGRLDVLFNGAMDAVTATDAANVLVTDSAGTPVLFDTLGLNLSPTQDTLSIDLFPSLVDSDCYSVDLTGMLSVDGADILNPTFTVRPVRGDINRDGVTSTSDASIIKPKFGGDAAIEGPEFDFNADGVISTADFSQVKPLFGNSAASCP